MIEIVNAVVEYQPYFANRKTVFEDISLTLNGGEVAVFVGPNGAGKTTLMRLVLGLIAPKKGSVRTLGIDPTNNRPMLMQRTGVLLNATRTFEPRWTPRDVLEFGASAHGVKDVQNRVEELLRLFNLVEYERTFVSALSTGTHQRLSLAFSLVHDPDVWVLDEPTLGLDIASRELLLHEIFRLKDKGGLVLLTSHDPSLVNQSFDRVFFIENGNVREEVGQGDVHLVRIRVNRVVPVPGILKIKEPYLIVGLEQLGGVIKQLTEIGVEVQHVESVSVLEKRNA